MILKVFPSFPFKKKCQIIDAIKNIKHRDGLRFQHLSLQNDFALDTSFPFQGQAVEPFVFIVTIPPIQKIQQYILLIDTTWQAGWSTKKIHELQTMLRIMFHPSQVGTGFCPPFLFHPFSSTIFISGLSQLSSVGCNIPGTGGSNVEAMCKALGRKPPQRPRSLNGRFCVMALHGNGQGCLHKI